MTFQRDRFIRDALDSGSFTFDEINQELKKRGVPTISPKMEAPLKIAQSKAFPWLAAGVTGLAATPAGLTGPGAGAGYLGASTIQKSIRDKAIGSGVPEDNIFDEMSSQAGNASLATILGWGAQGVGMAVGGIGKLYDILRSPSQIKKLGETRDKQLATKPAADFNKIQSDIISGVPGNRRIVGAGYKEGDVRAQIDNLLTSLQPKVQTVNTNPKDVLSGKPTMSLPDILSIVKNANANYKDTTSSLRTDITQAAADILRDQYIKPAVPGLNERMAYFQKLQPLRDITAKRAIGTGVATGLGGLGYGLLNLLRNKE